MPNRRRFVQACLAAASPLAAFTQQPDTLSADLLVYGATPAGIAAALAAARQGDSVLLIEPTARIGGMVTCGLSHTDFRTFEALTGAYLDFSRMVLAHYTREYGPGSPQVKDAFRGTQAEPKVNLLVFQQMLAAYPKLRLLQSHTLASVTRTPAGNRLESATFNTPAGASITCRPSHFIDATYEGDLLAAAGVPFRTGREGKAEYGESLAPDQPDNHLQGYNFRFAATRDPKNRVTPGQPAGYHRDDYTGILPLLADGRIRSIFGYPADCVYKAQIPFLPNGKYDLNDVSHSAVRLSLPNQNLGWPEGNAETRRRIFDEHLRWNVGLLWFLQNDGAVSSHVRAEARQWGWCKDEFVETANLPPQLYVREARRMTGVRIFTEHDTDQAPGDARAILHGDAIAMGDYSHNCHGTEHTGPRFGGRHTGEFYKQVMPYQIPYGTLLPRDVENLLVPVAASSSHVGFCALRLEPIWMSLGQAAGIAAHLARTQAIPVQKVSPAAIQRTLHSVGAATIYVSDVLPGHPDFAAVQWWGAHGGLHALAPREAGKRGDNILGQYFQAYQGHAAGLDQPLDPTTLERWTARARQLGITKPPKPPLTRGRWIQLVYRDHPHSESRP